MSPHHSKPDFDYTRHHLNVSLTKSKEYIGWSDFLKMKLYVTFLNVKIRYTDAHTLDMHKHVGELELTLTPMTKCEVH